MQLKLDYKSIENKLGYTFRDKTLLYNALVHSSYSNENKHPHGVNNERLEFLGDAVLELIISELLYKNYPQLAEGELTKMRAKIVCTDSLSKSAVQSNVGQFLLIGKGEEIQGGRIKKSILADTMEAIIGAIYLDSGLDSIREFIILQLKSIIIDVDQGNTNKDYKTILQEKVQSEKNQELFYKLIKEEGPDHSKIFYVDVFINSKKVASGKGKNKKQAEQNAAKKALNK